MSTESTHPLDPPYRRPTYHDGMLLEADDFLHEQEYHRKRLANALLRLHGAGTVAGLRVHWKKGSNEVAVAPDLRGIEERWYFRFDAGGVGLEIVELASLERTVR